MRKALALSLLFFAACASRRATSPLTRPEIDIAQISAVAIAARNVTGPIPVRYAVRVANRAGEPITLKRIQSQSIGAGAYTLQPNSTPFNVTIAPERFHEVEFWTNAIVERTTISGANGPVTLRLVLHFESPAGAFEEIVVRQVNERTGLAGEGPR
jgi:hypothetical protein